uniref:ATP synthase complex subunit 8 n=1 Tax=Dactylopsila trivirgata TaxID=38616 RepID=Q1MWI2_DACTR|nr:ATP synthase F0 subunit 8 [Dactylopsila trivirgata]BAE93984.1 ATP synthase subunit 8 [Dactylopsila trivirgata]
MPQLDTSTWSLTITLMLISLFCIYQLKMLNQTMTSISSQEDKILYPKPQLPWEKKWTKTYLLHSSHLLS